MIADAPDDVPRQARDRPGESKAALIDIKVIPRAGKTMVAGTREDALLIRLAAAPVDGAANTQLIAFLADLLDVPKRNIIVVAGEKSRTKKVKVIGLSAASVRARLQPEGK